MDAQLLQFFGSLAAITALVVAAHYLGFSKGGRLESEAEARSLFQLMPGGFEADEIALDAKGCGAIARDREHRLAVLVPHGKQFIARPLGPDAKSSVDGGTLKIDDPILGAKPIALRLGEAAANWANSSSAAK
ncbi:hypothetical protein [Erythrobacter alti]|uniref:hypothetical protein n=1 Tax=Erythrobacter alti TaxID=1896145 RepID=UPI0030F3ACF2